MVALALKKTSQSVEDVIPATFALLVLAAEKKKKSFATFLSSSFFSSAPQSLIWMTSELVMVSCQPLLWLVVNFPFLKFSHRKDYI